MNTNAQTASSLFPADQTRQFMALCMVLGLTAPAVTNAVSPVLPPVWGSPSSIAEQHSATGTDFRTSAAMGNDQIPSIEVRMAHRELVIAKNLMAELKGRPALWADLYLDRLSAIVESFLKDLTYHSAPSSQSVRALTTHLQSARVGLLDAAPTARQWMGLARIIEPEGSLRLPQRFIQRSTQTIHDIDLKHLEAAVWARSVAGA